MKKIIILLVLVNIKLFSQFSVGGSYENQSGLLAGSVPTDFINASIFKLDLNYKDDIWRFYSDMEVGLFYGIGNLIDANPNNFLYKHKFQNTKSQFGLSLDIKRLYIKLRSAIGTFTIGKHYITFGQPHMLHALEWDKSYLLVDPFAKKDGKNLISLDIPIGAYGKGKVFIGGTDAWDTPIGGAEIILGGSGYEIGTTYQYKGKNKNIIGAFFKADFYISLFGSYAYHINNLVTDKKFTQSHEMSIGVDYSFPIGFYTILVQQVFYYNSLGAKNKSELIDVGFGDYYFKAESYSYSSLLFSIDEFTSFGVDVMVSLSDGSGNVLPKVLLTVANNLTLDIAMAIFFGENGTEFGPKKDEVANMSMLVKLIASF